MDNGWKRDYNWEWGGMVASYGCPPPPKEAGEHDRFTIPAPLDWLPTAFLPTALGYYLLHRHKSVIIAQLTVNGWFSDGRRVDPKEYNEWRSIELP